MRAFAVTTLILITTLATAAAHPIQQELEPTPQTPAATAEALFAAHTQGRFERIEAFYTSGATVSLMQSGRVSTLKVKEYLAWYQGQYASRTSMKFVVGQTSVSMQGNIAAAWVPLEVQEVMKDGKQVTFRATASLQMFRETGVWKISGHAWQAAAN